MSIEKGDATKYVHTGNGELCYELNKALTVPETFPIYLSSAYIFDSIDPIDKICDEGAPGYAYFRLGNPNADATSQILAAGDGGEKGLVFSSGMAAITTSILATVKPGDHIVASPIIYGEAFYYLKYELKRWGVETTFIDFNTQDVADYIRPNTKLVYGETIANPLMSVPDIQHLADVAHANGAKLFIDNTFATSIIAKPIKYGADLVIYSATKYLGGHDDLVGGAVVGSEEIIKSLSFYLGLYGANLGATESWLLARSLRTLPLRVKKMAENGLALAKFFESHPKVEKVYYPGLESSPSKALADKQFEGNGYGGMLCVNFKGGQKEIDKLISNLQLVRFVPTLAGVGTTLTYPPRASHRDLSPDELAAIGITMGQIRLSSGLEDTDDLLKKLSFRNTYVNLLYERLVREHEIKNIVPEEHYRRHRLIVQRQIRELTGTLDAKGKEICRKYAINKVYKAVAGNDKFKLQSAAHALEKYEGESFYPETTAVLSALDGGVKNRDVRLPQKPYRGYD